MNTLAPTTLSKIVGTADSCYGEGTVDAAVALLADTSTLLSNELVLDDNEQQPTDCWYYSRPDLDSDTMFVVVAVYSNDRTKIVRVNKKTGATTEASRLPTEHLNMEFSTWYDYKIGYGIQGDYLYAVRESGGRAAIEVYRIDTLYEDNTYSFVTSLAAGGYHNIAVFQNQDCSWLYAVGGNRNALEVFDIRGGVPVYVGNYYGYPNNFVHTHPGLSNPDPTNPSEELYLHDIHVTDDLAGLDGKLVAFCSCIYYENMVILDVTDPTDIQTLVNVSDPRIQLGTRGLSGSMTNWGLHQAWTDPSKEFLIMNIENHTPHGFILDCASMFSSESYYYNGISTDDARKQTRFVGSFTINRGWNGASAVPSNHNLYCYPDPFGDDRYFCIICAAYNDGPMLFRADKAKIRLILTQTVESASPSIINSQLGNLDPAVTLISRFCKAGEDVTEPASAYNGSWTSLILPGTDLVLTSDFGSPFPTGNKIYRNPLGKFEGAETTTPQWEVDTVGYTSESLIFRMDPMAAVHPGFYSLTVISGEEQVYAVYTDRSGESTFMTYMHNGHLDIGHFAASGSPRIYTVRVVNVATGAEMTKSFNVQPHTYTAMNDYTANNAAMLLDMHPDVPIDEDLLLTLSVVASDLPEGGSVLTASTSNRFTFAPEQVSLYDAEHDAVPLGYFGHGHVYVYEMTMVMDMMTGEDLGMQMQWVKKGRIVTNKWHVPEAFAGKDLKVILNSNNHGRLVNGTVVQESTITV